MPRRLVRGKDRAVSPVIATIIIVAVAIVMSIAVAYWVLGLAGTFTRYEKIEIMSMYATKLDANTWKITAKLRNTGSATATINMVLINGKPWNDYSDDVTISVKVVEGDLTFDGVSEVTLDPGVSKTFEITIQATQSFVSGMSVEVTFHTAAGSDYPKVVVLP